MTPPPGQRPIDRHRRATELRLAAGALALLLGGGGGLIALLYGTGAAIVAVGIVLGSAALFVVTWLLLSLLHRWAES